MNALAEKLIALLETGEAPPGLFANDVFLDFTSPLWREQLQGADPVIAFRRRGHPAQGRVSRFRVDDIVNGFVLEVEERWDDRGGQWYCRELIRADVRDGVIAELAVYCTGDWTPERQAEHAVRVRLLRP